ncbi:heme ABC transporter ATP-binding protein [Boudabousia tangfeifanii]|uniref:Heme ABC transporter ATP-binding protein n=1 Tax=Boudabousia tangfeifanii TaxID=1912795 RepID=A0A1D9ML44_9ACTO|nr:ABC transporter ATP-binding protein [Boudabousia tangfeifanii]AOZ72995.1 heme ABC transporter ATP-binding protein [Boudabousia tangfeifanii]
MKLELSGITKVFGPLVANDHIDVVVEPGTIHALLGENGAGKSTLMNILYGLYQPDEGQILIDDKQVKFSGPGDAVAAGIGMVHQHFMLVPVFTVAESVALGYEPTGKAGSLDLAKARETVKRLSDRFGFDIDPDAYIEDLPVGAQQRVEIIKALSRDASVLILDEPTAVLTPQETDELLEIMRQLRAQGTSIILITHKLREVKAVADQITVIRRGKVVGTASPQASETELASAMVGREVDLTVRKDAPKLTDNLFQIKNLTVTSDNGQRLVDDVTLDVHGGEVLCIAGVQGNGQTELTEAILGSRQLAAGSLTLNGRDLGKLKIKDRLVSGLGFVPEDRSHDGMIATFTIAENMILDQYDQEPFAKGINMRPAVINEHCEKLREEFDVRVTSIHDRISTLSGGNQQKAILAREISKKLELLVVSQPTRGLDVGSIEFVHSRIISERDEGIPVVVVSTELDEVVGLADKIAVMYHGRVVGVVPPNTPRDVLGLMMAGVPLDQAQARVANTQEEAK